MIIRTGISRCRLVALITLTLAFAVLAGCGAAREEQADSASPEVAFEVIPEYLDDPYRNPQLGLAFRPPLGWAPLDESQRDQVAAALVPETEGEFYSLRIVDIFLNTDTLSFAVLSRVTTQGEPVSETPAYEAAFAQTIGAPSDDADAQDASASPEDEITNRAAFSVGGVDVIQFRHLIGERVTFTLIFTAADGTAAQLDYSIPASAYEEEGIKLESSIGSLQKTTPEETE